MKSQEIKDNLGDSPSQASASARLYGDMHAVVEPEHLYSVGAKSLPIILPHHLLSG